MSDPIKDFLQPISSWMFDDDKRIFESWDNVFLLVGIVVALVSSTAVLYRNYCEKNGYASNRMCCSWLFLWWFIF